LAEKKESQIVFEKTNNDFAREYGKIVNYAKKIANELEEIKNVSI
jgi:hypothetical protein